MVVIFNAYFVLGRFKVCIDIRTNKHAIVSGRSIVGQSGNKCVKADSMHTYIERNHKILICTSGYKPQIHSMTYTTDVLS